MNLGIAGFGRIARLVHLPALASTSECTIVAVADPAPSARDHARAQLPDAAVVERLDALLSLSQVDAVVVAVPTRRHAQVAIAAFAAGKHVYVEKPLALELAEAEAVIRAWEDAGTVGMIGFNFRHDARYVEARRRVLDGDIGRLIAVRSVFMTAPRPDAPSWKRSRDEGGGALFELASHDLDLVPFVCGRSAVALGAEIRSIASDQDVVRVSLTLEGDLTAECLASTCGSDEARLDVYGDSGKITVDRYRSASVEWQPASHSFSGIDAIRDGVRAAANRIPRVAAFRRRDPLHSYRNAFRSFTDAVQSGGSYGPDLRDGYRNRALIAAAERAADLGTSVTVDAVCDEDPARR